MLFLLLLTGTSFAVTVNDGFDPLPSAAVYATTVQADGKILVGGAFSTIGGLTRNRIARLNSDGSVDATFNPGASADVLALAVQPDGKILVGGDFTTIGGQTRTRIARLNSDGSVDTSFSPSSDRQVTCIVVQPDNKILVAGYILNLNGQPHRGIGRLNPDGSLDSGFDAHSTASVPVMALQPDGKIILPFGTYPGNKVARINPDGSLDSGFSATLDNNATAVALQPDGKVVIGGHFNLVNGQARKIIARLNSDGSLDPSFSTTVDANLYLIKIQPDGRIFLGGIFVTVNNQSRIALAHLNPDGTLTTVATGNANGNVETISFLPDGNIIIGGSFTTIGGVPHRFLARLNSEGILEPSSFAPTADSTVQSIAMQRDGKIVFGGWFGSLSDTSRKYVGRVNADGSLETAYNPNANAVVRSVYQQDDDKVVVGGGFSTVGGIARNHVARLNPDGTVDSSFNPDVNGDVYSTVVQADGKVLIGGSFNSIGAAMAQNLARVNADSSLDSGFATAVNGSITLSVLQPDGKIVIAGSFTAVGGLPKNHLARLNRDGTLDLAFDASADSEPACMAIQPDGKILIGGHFSTVNGAPQPYLARLNPDGSLDFSFSATIDNPVTTIRLAADSKIFIGGEFAYVNGAAHAHIARLNSDGSVDATFPDLGANGQVFGLSLQQDGKLVAGGTFTSLSGFWRNSIARVTNTGAALQSLTVSNDGTTATWNRSGTGPEVDRVTFQWSTDRSNWTNLGDGARISGGWQLTGCSFPTGQNIYLRARGYIYGADLGCSSSIIESVKVVFLPPAAPVARMATAVTATAFTAKWDASPGAIGYLLDLATDTGFTRFVPGFNGRDVKQVSSYAITGLSAASTYFYRVRAYNTGNVSGNSGTVTVSLDAPPLTTAAPGAGTYTSPQNVTLSCSDGAGSGCAATYYCFGPGCTPSTLYNGGTLAVSASTDLRFYSVDFSDNPEAVSTARYTIAIPTYSLLVTKEGTGSGKVLGPNIQCVSGSNCSSTFNSGSVVTLTATPASGSLFSGWNGACYGISGGDCTVLMDASKEVIATFDIDPLAPQLVARGNLGWSGSLNSLGEAVWTQLDPENGYYQVYSSQRGRLTVDQADHLSPAINNMADVVWVTGNTVQGIIGGRSLTLATSPFPISKVDINDVGEAVWSQDEGGAGARIYSSIRGQLTSSPVSNNKPSINNHGDVAYIKYDAAAPETAQILTLSGGTTTTVSAVSSGFYLGDVAINDGGDVVWKEQDQATTFSRIVSSARGLLVSTDHVFSIDVNNCGDIMYMASTPEGQSLYRLGLNAPCASYSGSHDTVDKAAAVSFGEPITGVADNVSAPVTWYRFAATVGDSIDITVNFGTLPSNALAIGVYDGQGNLISPAVAGPPLSVRLIATYSGTYFLKVEGRGGRTGYAVSVQRTAPLLKLIAQGQPEAYFSTLGDFFAKAPAVPEMRLFCRDGDFAEDLTMALCDETIRAVGGFDPTFSAVSGISRIKGAVKVTCGKLVADGLAIR